MKVDRFFSVFKTASRGMDIQRKQLALSAENIANAYTTRVDGQDGPYKPKAMTTALSDEQQFKLKLDNANLSLKETRSGHIDGQFGFSSQDALADMSPDEEIIEQEKYRYEYDPSHPDADANGMVKYPDLDLVEEMTQMVSANRLYEANLAVVEAEKQVLKRAFEI
ncbi:flagellar basal body rod protein FlgC [bacterium]|nr:MAG: flagellar basal body rod protein FlgC [bacterium]